ARALEVTDKIARLAFITPSDWLDVNYGYAMKEHLLERAQVEALVFFEPDTVFGRGVRADAVITLIRKGATGATRIIRLGSRLPAAEDVLEALAGRGALATDEIVLSPDAKWARPRARRRTRGLRLADVARVRRGV